MVTVINKDSNGRLIPDLSKVTIDLDKNPHIEAILKDYQSKVKKTA